MAGHNKLLIALIIATVLTLFLTFAFNSLGSMDVVPSLFENGTAIGAMKYSSGITPSSWVFSIWGFIYTWQCLIIIFVIVNIFRKTPDGPAYTNPMILTPLFFVFYILNFGFNVGWVVLIRKDFVVLAFFSLGLIAFSLFICMFIAYRNLYQNGFQMQKQGRNIEIILHRVFVHNGLGIYAAWTSIATLLNAVFVMVYSVSPSVPKGDAGTVALGILAGEFVVFAASDFFFLDKYSRYTITPYIVVALALGGSIDRHWGENQTNSLFTAILLGVTLACAVVKVILTIWRHIRYPLYDNEISTKAQIKE